MLFKLNENGETFFFYYYFYREIPLCVLSLSPCKKNKEKKKLDYICFYILKLKYFKECVITSAVS